jgi:DNA-binding beta-propeller fold protein YncE
LGALAYDPANGYVYAGTSSGLASIDSSTNRITKNVSLGFQPTFIGYNPGNHMIYAVGFDTFSDAMFNPASASVTKLDFNTTYYSTPSPETYNPTLNVYYSRDLYGLYIYVVDSSSNTLEASLRMGANLRGIAFDDSNGMLYVADSGNSTILGSILAVDSSSNSVVANITDGTDFHPSGIVFDPSNGYLYVMSTVSEHLSSENPGYTFINNVSIIDTKTNTFVQTVLSVAGLFYGAVYAKQANRIYFASMMVGGGVSILGMDDRTNTIVSNTTIDYHIIEVPWGLIYNPRNTCLYVSGTTSGTVNVVTVPTP